MKKTVKNVAASVRDRLLAGAHQRREDFTLTLQRYAAERFLYRLGESRYRDQFVLKGAMLFALWGGPIYRPTRDLDFAGYGSSEAEDVIGCFREICALAVEDDGLVFDAATLAAEPIRDDAEYDGLRVRFRATLGTAYIPMQIDVGFGNAIEPPANDVDYPTLLDLPAPRIRAYPHEAVVAEKLHAMVLLGERTSRFKDYYDLYVLARQFPFGGQCLTRAIGATFERRRTRIDTARPAALAPRFFAEPLRAAQWRTYLDSNRLPGAPAAFDAVGEQLRAFLGPPWDALAEKSRFHLSWQPGDRWGPGEAGSLAALTLSTPTRGEGLEPIVVHIGGDVVSGRMESREKPGLQRLKPYPEYKDSGVEWLGEIPAHWEVRRLKTVAFVQLSNVDKKSLEGQESVRLCNYVDVYYNERIPADLDFMAATATPEQVLRFSLRAGDILITKDSESWTDIAVPAVVAENLPGVLCGYHLALVRPGAECYGAFLARAFAAIGPRDQFQIAANGITRFGLGGDAIRASLFATPPVPEQRTIAAFLDRETVKIDALVAKKERLIELLQEKRTALISRAVTKGLPAAAAAQAGLDPHVPMKDSGVEWLGKIPEHYKIMRIKYLLRRIIDTEHKTAPFYPEGDFLVVRTSDVKNGLLELKDSKYTGRAGFEEWTRRGRPEPGDILFTREAPAGEACLVPDKPALCLGQRMVLFKVDHRKLEGRFGVYALYGGLADEFVDLLSQGSTVAHFNMADIGNIPVVTSPPQEQSSIADYLDGEADKIDSLLSRIRDGIDRLMEFRTTLISAVVTGKIDVRMEAA